MNLLVTGGAGFIGSNFVRYWAARASRRHASSSSTRSRTPATARTSTASPHEFVHGDIGDIDVAMETSARRTRSTSIVNFAAESHNSYAITNPGVFFRTNVVGTQTLCEAARRVGVEPRFHHVSTCEVYGDLALDSDEPFTESSPYRPRTPYNASKAGGDHAVRAYYETFGLPITITNCANNYGPYQFPEKVIPLFTTRALDDQPLPLYASTAEPARVDPRRSTTAARSRAMLDDGRVGETYHVGTGVERSIEEIADAVLAALGKPASLKTIVPDRPGHDRRYLLDCVEDPRRARLGSRRSTFEAGLEETVEWYAANRAWWEPLLERAPVDETAAWK